MPTDFINNCTTRHCGNTSFSQVNGGAIFEETDIPFAEILKLTFQVFIALFGVIGNVLVAIVLRGLGKKKKTADFYVQNLAIADLGILLLTFPLAAIREKAPFKWPFGEFSCLYLYPVPEIFYGASVWFITVIAIERYQNIVTMKVPGQIKKKILLKRAKIVAACVWVPSFLTLCLPLYFVVEYFELPNADKWCGPVWPSWVLARIYIVFMTLFLYIVPLVVIFLTYLSISRTLNQSSVFIKAMKEVNVALVEDRQRSSLTSVKSVRLNQNNRAKKILTPLMVVFSVTMLPLNIFRLICVFWPVLATQEYFKNLMYAVSVCVILNSSVNPVIYSVVSRDFRKGIKNLFR